MTPTGHTIKLFVNDIYPISRVELMIYQQHEIPDSAQVIDLKPAFLEIAA